MQITNYHAKYFAHELTRRWPSDSVEKLAGTVAAAQVDLNPHQVDAALFAFRSPLSKGALLADEVGLGKTIEAGLVISQRWAERRRHILVITPSNLRKQWHQELAEKFFLPAEIIEANSYNSAVRTGNVQPFLRSDAVVICSYEFARTRAGEVAVVPWDLVVIDEAHRLRNVYKPSNIIANTLRGALADAPKLLLTATPLQNSLLELYGLVSFIDEHAFGDVKSFREQFAVLGKGDAFQSLKDRLRPICHRTLRRQVTAYVPYTRRHAMVERFTPEQEEGRLYELVSEYLRRPNLQALPAGQRTLITLVLRKLLASSTFAIAGALETMSRRLRARLDASPVDENFEQELEEDFDALADTAEEWPDDPASPSLTKHERAAIEAEIRDLEEFVRLALSVEENSKGTALVKALALAFERAEALGASRKALIFTESRRTQDYLLRLLSKSPFAEGIVLFNGSNADARSREIYAAWVARHAGSDRVTGSRTADMRSALVDYFRDEGQIMIATEAGAEGINLQFCSLVVNYDLPWNPQRIEQRIGRCHRYGQKHDVVVVNFLNRTNEADQRVYQLLDEKFRLFDGVFGSSDEILGAVESGVDFERRIVEIYQRCRRPDEIKAAFDDLQRELSAEIDEAMSSTRRKLLEHFDDEVREKLRGFGEKAASSRSRFEQWLMALTRHELRGHAEFLDEDAFRLNSVPDGIHAQSGLYELPRRSRDAHFYRLGTPLADALVARARDRHLPVTTVVLDYTAHPGNIASVKPLVGTKGWMSAWVSTLASLDQTEDHLVLTGVVDAGEMLDEDLLRRLLTLPARQTATSPGFPPTVLREEASAKHAQLQRMVSERNARFFEEEASKLDRWADDLKVGLEREIKEIDRQIKDVRRAGTGALLLEDKLAGQKQIRELEQLRGQKRRSLFDAQDEVDRNRDRLIEQIEAKLPQSSSQVHLFTFHWIVR